MAYFHLDDCVEARRLMLISINEGTEDILAARRVAEVMANVGK